MDLLQIANAILISDEGVLVARNNEGPELYLPGGKVELGEGILHALYREMSEEFPHIVLLNHKLYDSVCFRTPRSNKSAKAHAFICEFSGSTEPAADIRGIGWARQPGPQYTKPTNYFLSKLLEERHI